MIAFSKLHEPLSVPDSVKVWMKSTHFCVNREFYCPSKCGGLWKKNEIKFRGCISTGWDSAFLRHPGCAGGLAELVDSVCKECKHLVSVWI